MIYKFFAFLSRMKYINRWSLMRNNQSENIQEHSAQVAIFAHALSMISNKHFGGKVDPGKATELALFHDCAEIITSDLPTPVKYYNEETKAVFKTFEKQVIVRLLGMLPEEFYGEYSNLLLGNGMYENEWKFVHAADKLAAYVKCLEELKTGNREFAKAATEIEAQVRELQLPEVDYFMKHFVPAFNYTLDEF